MATKVIDRNESRIPFWGDTMSFITGLDPLGQQNASIQTYSHLLPGLNNVTTRIRSYSFYCWLLTEYARIIKSTNPYEQVRFVRRAEYIIALLSAYKQIPGVSGVLYANNRMLENLNVFDLEKGTFNPDGTTEKTYWKNYTGVLGQYYLGSLRSIGLIEEPVNDRGEFLGIYRRTFRKDGIKVTGEDLAEAFEENLKPDDKAIFLECINNGFVTLNQLEALSSSFNLTNIKDGSKENQLLIDLLFDVDEPANELKNNTSMRRESILHLLRFTKNSAVDFNIRQFTQYIYDQKDKFNGSSDPCLTGWYFYQLNEYWQYANAAIFNAALRYVDENRSGRMPLNELIDELTGQVVRYLINENFINDENVVIEQILDSILITERNINERLTQKGIFDRMAYGFLMIWKLYIENKVNLESLRDYTTEREIGNTDDIINYYIRFQKQMQVKIIPFISDFILQHILMRHQQVAYRKMGSGSQSTQKFLIENYQLIVLEVISPENTSPRLNNQVAFLRDLHLFSSENQLTTKGETILSQFER